MRFLYYVCIFYQPPPKVPEVECEDPHFRYIFEYKGYQKVCFGCSKERSTGLVGKGLAPHQRKITPEVYPNISPNKYELEPFASSMWPILHKIRSKYGVPGLGNKEKRWPDKETMKTPSPVDHAYPLIKKYYRQCPKPFGIGAKVGELKVKNYPGPGYYDLTKIYKCRRPPGQYNLGHPEILPCIEMICEKSPTHTCYLCNKLCQGDYWHKKKELFICQVCWFIEKVTKENLSLKKLKEFKKMRNCSFMHEHNHTTAALRILPSEKIKKKLRLENYLNVYLSCYD